MATGIGRSVLPLRGLIPCENTGVAPINKLAIRIDLTIVSHSSWHNCDDNVGRSQGKV